MDPNIIIDAIGGTGAVAKLCEVSAQAVTGWRKKNKIPNARLMYLKQIRPKIFAELQRGGD